MRDLREGKVRYATAMDSFAARSARRMASADARITAAGKLLMRDSEPFYIRGVTYGTFAPDENGDQFPPQAQVIADFRNIAANGFNTLRTYTVAPPRVLDAAAAR